MSIFFRNFKMQVAALILLGLIIYGNTFLNGFIADDYHQIVDNQTVHSLKNLPAFFTGSTFYTGSSELAGNYYKPLLTTVYAVLYALFGQNPFGYHVAQVLLHIANAILIFLFCKFYFKSLMALVVSLLFLVHPLNTEAVVYVANLQDILFLFFGMSALVIDKITAIRYKAVAVGVLLLFSLLSKETGVVFTIVYLLSGLLFSRKHFYQQIIVAIAVLLMYALLRFAIAGIYLNSIITAPIMKLSLLERLLQIPYIVFFLS